MPVLNKILNQKSVIKILLIYILSGLANTSIAQTNIELAEQFLQQKNEYKALYYYQLALSQNTDDVDALYGIAMIEYSNSQYENALMRLNLLTAKAPGNVKALILKGESYAKQQRWDDAIKTIQAAEALDSNNARVHFALDSTYSAMGDTVNAKKSAAKYNEIKALNADRARN